MTDQKEYKKEFYRLLGEEARARGMTTREVRNDRAVKKAAADEAKRQELLQRQTDRLKNKRPVTDSRLREMAQVLILTAKERDMPRLAEAAALINPNAQNVYDHLMREHTG
jgi:hypothetical protein